MTLAEFKFNKEFQELLNKIEKKEDVNQSEILPFLIILEVEIRCYVCYKLAEYYFNFNKEKLAVLAGEYIKRAWLLSDNQEEILPTYIKIFQHLRNIEEIKIAYKTTAINYANSFNINKAIEYFDKWQYSECGITSLDKYSYDFDVLNAIERLAIPYFIITKKKKEKKKNYKKKKLAYLAIHVGVSGSVLMKILFTLVKYCDKLKYEIAIFIPHTLQEIDQSQGIKKDIDTLQSYGCKIFFSNNRLYSDRHISLAAQINEYSPDLLITMAALASFSQYFISLLIPQIVKIAYVFGPPPQFVSKKFTRSITAVKHTLIDTPVNCSLVRLEFDLPEKNEERKYRGNITGVNNDSCIILSAGRYPKFQNKEFWEAVFLVLSTHINTYFVVLGVEKNQIALVTEIPQAIESRVVFLGWKGKEYYDIVNSSDIIVDTFPSGGGVTLIDAMALAKPIVTFQNDYSHFYCQTDWSVGSEYLNISELVIERYNFNALIQLINKLIVDKSYRQEMGEKCYKESLQFNNPKRMVENIEIIYGDLLNKDNLFTKKKSDSASYLNENINIVDLSKLYIKSMKKIIINNLSKVFKKIKIF